MFHRISIQIYCERFNLIDERSTLPRFDAEVRLHEMFRCILCRHMDSQNNPDIEMQDVNARGNHDNIRPA